MMAYADYLSKNFTSNVVVQVGGSTYFALRAPDSGLTLDDDKVNVVRRVKIPSLKLNLREAFGSVGSASIDFIDKEGAFSTFVGANETALYSYDIIIYHGFVGVGMDFTEYKTVAKLRLKKPTFRKDVWTFDCYSLVDRAKQNAFVEFTQLANLLTDVQTTAVVDSTTDFPSSGIIEIDGEYMTYSSKTATTFVISARGYLGSTAAAHPVDSEVHYVEAITANPIIAALQLLASTGAGTNGVYDVLTDGCGITASDLDTDAFVAAAAFISGTYTFYPSDITDVLDRKSVV